MLYLQRTGILNFVCGEVLVVIDSGQNPAGLILSDKKPFTLTFTTGPTKKSTEATEAKATCHFGGRVRHKNSMPESIVPNIIKSFFDVKKHSYYVFSSVKLSITDWESLKK